MDVFHRTTPKPVIVQEVRIPFGTRRTGAVTLRTPGLEHRSTRRHRIILKFRVTRNGRKFQSLQLCVDRRICRFDRSDFSFNLGARGPAQHARGCLTHQRPGRIGDAIADPPDDGGVEHPKPPARHRVVELHDPIPLMAGGVWITFLDLYGVFVARLTHFWASG